MEKFSLIYPKGYKVNEEDGFSDFGFIEDLGLNHMIYFKSESYLGIRDLKLGSFFTKNPEVLKYRTDIVDDIYSNRKIYDIFCKIVPMIQNIEDMRRVSNQSDMTAESNLFSIKILELYVEIMDFLGKEFIPIEVKSRGLLEFKEIISERYDSEEYKNLHNDLSKMETRIGGIRSVTIGINMDGSLQAREAGIVSINTKEYKEGSIVNKLLGKNGQDSFTCITGLNSIIKTLDKQEQYTFQTTLNHCMDKIFKRTIKNFEPVVNKFFKESTDFLTDILDDLRFLNGAMEFIFDMKDRGLSMCKPKIAPMSEKKCTLKGVYNPMVAIKVPESQIVTNDFQFDENGRFYIITGPNHGGKSVFLYAVGMTQALFQLGLFVPAESAEISPVDGIYTHFPSSDENNYGKGRLESECSRLSITLDKAGKDSLILLDEAFSSTSGTEASYIASEVITALGIIGLRGLFVTHIHDLPMKINEFNSHPDNKSRVDNLAAQMENKADGVRSYRIVRTTPDGLSYAKDIARKYGLILDNIINKNR